MNDEQYAAAIVQMIVLEQAPDAATNNELVALSAAVEAYETVAGHTPAPPQTLVGRLEVEMFKRRMKQKQLASLLEIPEPRLSEIMRGKSKANLDFVKRIWAKLGIPAEEVLRLS